MLSLKDITLVDKNGKKSLTGLNLCLRSSQILGIAGVSGNGQSQLADMISGLVPTYEGEILLDSKVVSHISPRRMITEGVGRIPDDRTGTGLISDRSVMENVASNGYGQFPFSKRGLLQFKAIAARANRLVKKFDVRFPG